jgi:hypothetical protein
MIQPPRGHRTTLVTPPDTRLRLWLGEQPIPIDEELAPAIGTCWQLGITTVSCCQQDHLLQVARISMHRHRDLEAFLNVILGPPPADTGDLTDDLALRMRNWSIPTEPVVYPGRRRWEFVSVPDAYQVRWDMFSEVRFPHDDIGEVTRRLQAATRVTSGHERIPA